MRARRCWDWPPHPHHRASKRHTTCRAAQPRGAHTPGARATVASRGPGRGRQRGGQRLRTRAHAAPGQPNAARVPWCRGNGSSSSKRLQWQQHLQQSHTAVHHSWATATAAVAADALSGNSTYSSPTQRPHTARTRACAQSPGSGACPIWGHGGGNSSSNSSTAFTRQERDQQRPRPTQARSVSAHQGARRDRSAAAGGGFRWRADGGMVTAAAAAGRETLCRPLAVAVAR